MYECMFCGDEFTSGGCYTHANDHCWGCHHLMVIASDGDDEGMKEMYQKMKIEAEGETYKQSFSNLMIGKIIR